jgi:hypothetical protein
LPSRVAPNRPKDSPHFIRDRGTYDEAIAPYVAQARKTYGEAKRGFFEGGNVVEKFWIANFAERKLATPAGVALPSCGIVCQPTTGA